AQRSDKYEELNLIGKVKRVDSHRFALKNENNEVKAGAKLNEDSYVLDKNGKLLTVYDYNFSEPDKALLNTTKYSTNSGDNALTERVFDASNALKSKYSYTY